MWLAYTPSRPVLVLFCISQDCCCSFHMDSLCCSGRRFLLCRCVSSLERVVKQRILSYIHWWSSFLLISWHNVLHDNNCANSRLSVKSTLLLTLSFSQCRRKPYTTLHQKKVFINPNGFFFFVFNFFFFLQNLRISQNPKGCPVLSFMQPIVQNPKCLYSLSYITEKSIWSSHVRSKNQQMFAIFACKMTKTID